jgi:hypothetical protein
LILALLRARAAFDKATRGNLRLLLPDAYSVISTIMILSPANRVFVLDR